jgi:hypothetical protein
MKKLDRIINESINRVITENKFRNIFTKLKASLAIAKKKGDEKTAEEIENKLAMLYAVVDINRSNGHNRLIPTIGRTRRENGGDIPSGVDAQKFDEFMNSDYEFNTRITPKILKDAEDWLNNRDNNPYENE